MLYSEENEEEYEDFYDFSSDYSNVPQEVTELKRFERKYKSSFHLFYDSKVSISENGSELIFENGKSVGHRSLKLYFKQRVRPNETRDCVIINTLMNQYKAIGWHDTKYRDTNQSIEFNKHVSKSKMQLGVKANNLQRHFKDRNSIIA